MGFKTLGAVLAHAQTAAGSDTWILMGLAFHANDDTQVAWPSSNRLARYASIAPKNVSRSLRRLEREGYIRKIGPYPHDPPNRARFMYQVTIQCHALCFSASPGMHYPQGDEDFGYPPLHPGGPDDPNAPQMVSEPSEADRRDSQDARSGKWSETGPETLDPSLMRTQNDSGPSSVRTQEGEGNADVPGFNNSGSSLVRTQNDSGPSSVRTQEGEIGSDPSPVRGQEGSGSSLRTPRVLTGEGLIEVNKESLVNDLSLVNADRENRDLQRAQFQLREPVDYLAEPAPGKSWKDTTTLTGKTKSGIARAFVEVWQREITEMPVPQGLSGRIAKKATAYITGDEKNSEQIIKSAMYAACLARTFYQHTVKSLGAPPTGKNICAAVENTYELLLEGQEYRIVSQAVRMTAEEGQWRVDINVSKIHRATGTGEIKPAKTSGGLTRAARAKAEYLKNQAAKSETDTGEVEASAPEEEFVEAEVVEEEAE